MVQPVMPQTCPSVQGSLQRIDMLAGQPPRWLLWGMLERGSLAMVFGEPGCGKSFLALDWTCRVATGTPWRGRPVQAGPVVYLAAESPGSIARRLHAWQQHNGVSLAGAPLFIGPAVAIAHADERAELVAAVERQVAAPVLVVLDTLARCFADGDENRVEDMVRFIAACECLRDRWGCTVLVLHHCGHRHKDRPRGAAVLTAALDAQYRLVRTKRLRLTAAKLREAEKPAPVAMDLVKVGLHGVVDECGEPVTSMAVEVAEAKCKKR